MNAAHWHLIVNHIALFGVGFGLLLQLAALFRKSRDLSAGALVLFLIAAAGSIAAHQTGEAAAHMVRHLPWVEKGCIHAHAEAADKANIVTIALGILALAGWFAARASEKWGRILSIVVVLTAAAATGWMAWTCDLGGRIRHTEIRPAITLKAIVPSSSTSDACRRASSSRTC